MFEWSEVTEKTWKKKRTGQPSKFENFHKNIGWITGLPTWKTLPAPVSPMNLYLFLNKFCVSSNIFYLWFIETAVS